MPQIKANNQTPNHAYFMSLALKQASIAESCGEVPVGAIITKNNQVIASSYNLKESGPSATYHAEVLAIEQAAKKLGQWRLSDCSLYTTLEPCLMCSGAIVAARLKEVIYGAYDYKAGAFGSVFNFSNHEKLNHKVHVVNGILQDQCSQILKDFFAKKRA